MKKIITLFVLFINLCFGQTNTIIGVVKDSAGVIPGVNIHNKNSKLYIISDFDGTFKINAKLNDTLIFSFVGKIEQIIKVENFKNLNVFLKEGKKIETITLPYYQTVRKKNPTDPTFSNTLIKAVSYQIYIVKGKTNKLSVNDLEFQQKYKAIFVVLENNLSIDLKSYKLANYKIFEKLNDNFDTDDWINDIHPESLGLKDWMFENDIEFNN